MTVSSYLLSYGRPALLTYLLSYGRPALLTAIKLANCHSFLFNTHTEFEWDHEKSLSNLDKHGIDFENAKALWKDVERIEIKTAYPLEERYVLIGKLDN